VSDLKADVFGRRAQGEGVGVGAPKGEHAVVVGGAGAALSLSNVEQGLAKRIDLGFRAQAAVAQALAARCFEGGVDNAGVAAVVQCQDTVVVPAVDVDPEIHPGLQARGSGEGFLR